MDRKQCFTANLCRPGSVGERQAFTVQLGLDFSIPEGRYLGWGAYVPDLGTLAGAIYLGSRGLGYLGFGTLAGADSEKSRNPEHRYLRWQIRYMAVLR